MKYKITCAGFYDLRKTMECGQIFHYSVDSNGGYNVAQGATFCNVQQTDDLHLDIECEENKLEYWRTFLGVDQDLRAFERRLSEYLGNNLVVAEGTGLRLLLQTPWEAFVQFLGATNRTVDLIYKSYQSVTRRSGIELAPGLYALLPPEELARHDLSPCNLGYRLKAFSNAVRAVARDGGEAYLDSVAQLPLQEAIALLKQYSNVGPKVAGCIALYGLHMTHAFPVDTQIDKALSRLNKTSAGFQTTFRGEAGLAQLYLYQWMRS